MIKKRILLILLVGIFAFTPITVLASSIGVAPVTITVDNQLVTSDVPPQIVNSRTFVPIRFLANALGAEVSWNQAQRMVLVIKGSDQIQLFIGGDALKNGALMPVDVPPFIVSGRTMVPLRFISEAFGCKVDWNEEERRVIVESKSNNSQQPGSPSVNTPGNKVQPPASGNNFIDRDPGKSFKVQLLVGVTSVRVGLKDSLNISGFTAVAEVNGVVTPLVPNERGTAFNGVQLDGTTYLDDTVTVTITETSTGKQDTYILSKNAGNGY